MTNTQTQLSVTKPGRSPLTQHTAELARQVTKMSSDNARTRQVENIAPIGKIINHIAS